LFVLRDELEFGEVASWNSCLEGFDYEELGFGEFWNEVFQAVVVAMY